jgi:uncharacterized protein (DUF1330 family)
LENIMPAYIVALIEPRDRDAAERYRTIAADTIARYGGRYIVRGGAIADTLEGETGGVKRVIVLEFPDLDAARTWYSSPEYDETRPLRERAFQRTMLLAEGIA